MRTQHAESPHVEFWPLVRFSRKDLWWSIEERAGEFVDNLSGLKRHGEPKVGQLDVPLAIQ